MQLSFQNFGFTAILIMVAALSLANLWKYLRERVYHDKNGSPQKIKVDG